MGATSEQGSDAFKNEQPVHQVALDGFYMIVVGDRDMENKTVSVRTRAGEDMGAMSLEDFTAKLKEVVDSKVIQ